MIKYDFKNTSANVVGAEHGITNDDIVSIMPQIIEAHEQFNKWRASRDAIFFDYPFEPGLISTLRKTSEEVRNSFDNLVVLGIGGSALGLRCIANTLLPQNVNLLSRDRRGNIPRLFICDNVDPESFSSILEIVDLKETCFNIISKSGTTTETLSQLFLILPMLKAQLGKKWKDHIYITTDPESGPLRRFSVQEGIKSFDVPQKLGGRYSVLSSVGLFPAACLGVDIEGLIDGAKRMTNMCSSSDLELNPAYKNAVIHYLMYTKKGKNISVMMPYTDRFSLFADWYIQLFAESLGKKGLGMTPIKAVGATDQHSQMQLFIEGPNDKVITILGVKKFSKSSPMTQVMESFEYLKGNGLAEIMKASEVGSSEALAHSKRPNIIIELPQNSPQALGQLFMFYEISTVFMGALMNVDPFNQPGVEIGKRLIKKILSERP